MPFTTAQLTAEIQNDPAGLGYAAFFDAADEDQQIAGLLNQVRGTISVFLPNVSPSAVAAALVKADWDALAAGDKQLFASLLAVQSFDLTSASLRLLFGALFPAGSTTRANLLAIASRNGSRAEQLWGTGTSVSLTAVAVALGRG